MTFDLSADFDLKGNGPMRNAEHSSRRGFLAAGLAGASAGIL